MMIKVMLLWIFMIAVMIMGVMEKFISIVIGRIV